MREALSVRLLGPIDVLDAAGQPRAVAGKRLKAVLAALALQPGRVVSVDQLMDIVWGNAVPATGAATLQSHVSHLRRALGDRSAVRACPPGYLLDLDGQATDVATAERLIGESSLRADPAGREKLLADAVALWRGQADAGPVPVRAAGRSTGDLPAAAAHPRGGPRADACPVAA
ncbi:winged helix-turn-helix domain-containing protein [Actinocrispum sp. NPDC049592]|uniref:AfsR/SARP family transcriptional regulator n=1 Tax=Actinocrispum sp. NPDC049592 TaxID=3154835 RepID=UPI0034240881